MKESHIIIVLSFIILFSSINSDDCDDLMNYYTKNIDPMNFENPIMSSGTGFDDLGKYDLCMHNQLKFYVGVVNLALKNPILPNLKIHMGLCLPLICANDKKLEEYKFVISNLTKTPEEKILFIDTEKENNLNSVFNFSSILFLIFLCFFLAFSSGLVKYFVYKFWKNTIVEKQEDEILLKHEGEGAAGAEEGGPPAAAEAPGC